MKEISIVLLGFGSANSALVEMLLRKSVFHHHRRCLHITSASTGEQRCIPWRVVAIVTGRHGRVHIPMTTNPEGIWYEVDVEEALRRISDADGFMDSSLIVKIEKLSTDHKITSVQNQEQIDSQDDGCTTPQQTIELLQRLANAKAANIVAEAIPSNPRDGGGEPAVSFIRTALEAGMHVVSANKGPLAQLHRCVWPDPNTIRMEEVYWKLQEIAASNGVQYMHESAVMDGVPIFSLWQNTLPHANLTKLRGCLNGTTTMILTRMEGPDGETFDEALSAAKKMGIVEADESLDIDGYDAAVKLRAILVVFLKSSQTEGISLRLPSIDEIPRDSIRNITKDDIKHAFNDGGKKYRLVASAGEYIDELYEPNDEYDLIVEFVVALELVETLINDGVTDCREWKAKVELEQILPTDPIYNLTGTSSSVQLFTDVLGPITMVSTDPTLVDTAYGLFSDIVRVAGSN